jgi:hypothetical protein
MMGPSMHLLSWSADDDGVMVTRAREADRLGASTLGPTTEEVNNTTIDRTTILLGRIARRAPAHRSASPRL